MLNEVKIDNAKPIWAIVWTETEKHKRIYLYTFNKIHYCVANGSEINFLDGKPYQISQWANIEFQKNRPMAQSEKELWEMFRELQSSYQAVSSLNIELLARLKLEDERKEWIGKVVGFFNYYELDDADEVPLIDLVRFACDLKKLIAEVPK